MGPGHGAADRRTPQPPAAWRREGHAGPLETQRALPGRAGVVPRLDAGVPHAGDPLPLSGPGAARGAAGRGAQPVVRPAVTQPAARGPGVLGARPRRGRRRRAGGARGRRRPRRGARGAQGAPARSRRHRGPAATARQNKAAPRSSASRGCHGRSQSGSASRCCAARPCYPEAPPPVAAPLREDMHRWL